MSRNFEELKPQRPVSKKKEESHEKKVAHKKKVEEEEYIDDSVAPVCENVSFLTEEDYLEFTKHMIEPKIKFRVTLWSIVSVLFGALLMYRDLVGIEKNALNFALSIALIVFGLLFVLYFNILMPQKTAKQYAEEDYKVSPTKKPYKRFRFFPERLKSNTDAGTSNDIRYEKINSTKETKNLYVLQISEQHAYLMRKDAFIAGTFEEAKALVDAGIDRRKDKEHQEKIEQLDKAKQERHSVKRGAKLFGKKDK